MFSSPKRLTTPKAGSMVSAAPLLTLLTLALGASVACAALDRTPPTKPANFRVTAKTAYSVSLAWGSSTDNSGNFSYVLADTAGQRVTLPKSATSYTFSSGLFPKNSYTFIIQAVDAAGNSSSPISVAATLPADTTPPRTAPGLSVAAVGSSYVSLAWTAAQDDGPYLYYEVFLGGSPYAYAGTNLSATLTSLQPGTTYTFNVQAHDPGGNLSPLSNPVTITTSTASTDTTPPTPPSDLADYGMTFEDGETWVFWTQSTDDQTPQSQIRYDVYVNGVSDGSTTGNGGPWIFYAQLGALNTLTIIAVDEEGNQSSPGTFTLDLR